MGYRRVGAVATCKCLAVGADESEMVLEVRVRSVAFRNGTDADLAALRAVEIPIQDERGSDRMPRPLDSYIALARNLPSQFDDYTWITEAPDGTPVAVAYCWSNAAGDPRVMECDVLVHRDWRRQRIGSRLLAEICGQTATSGRSMLTWSTFDAVPAADAFSRRVGGRVARTNRTSELVLAHVDWPMVDDWARAGRARDERGYSMEVIVGPFPERLRPDAAAFHHIMQTAPRDDLDVGAVHLEPAHIAELDRSLVEAGRMRWTIFVRDPVGACVGGTEVTFEPEEPSVVRQQNTGIDPEHRGLGLARWVKATMLQRIRDKRPEAVRIRADNAFSNAPMLAINDALGFQTVRTRTEWQASVDEV
ncbi:GNAT family N-acetyltransferase [soil metagenome]